MKGRELHEEILVLARQSQTVYPAEPREIYTYINRAIDEVNRLCPVRGTASVLHFPITPLVCREGVTVHKGGEDINVDARDIASLAFLVSGTGKAILSVNGVPKKTFEWLDQSVFKLIRYHVGKETGEDRADIELCFTGPYTYMIKDLSMYGEVVGDLEEDVDVYKRMVGYDIASSRYAGERFMDFASLPVRYDDTRLNAPTDYKIEGTRVFLPVKKPGIYEIEYFKKPGEVNENTLDVEIDVDERLTDLLALRAGYYFYMMVDREIADRCNAEYVRLYGTVMATLNKVRTPVKFREARSW